MLNSVWTRLPCWMSKGPLKRDFLDIYRTTFFGVRNFENTSAMRVNVFFWKCSKHNLDCKNAEKYLESIFRFWDNCIWVGFVKLSLLRSECLQQAVNVLTNSPEITFSNSIAFKVINKYGKGTVVQISMLFRPVSHVPCQSVVWSESF